MINKGEKMKEVVNKVNEMIKDLESIDVECICGGFEGNSEMIDSLYSVLDLLKKSN